MPNTFVYPEGLEPSEKRLLKTRESVLDETFKESTHLEWNKTERDDGATLFSIIKRGLVDTELGQFTEQELSDISNGSFSDNVSNYDVQDESERSKIYLQNRIDDWIDRLNSLYDEVESWAAENWTVTRSCVMQRNEELMRSYSIAPKEVPTCSIRSGSQRIDLTPSALWIIGADGRVNVTTKSKQYILVDRRLENDDPSDWQIALSQKRISTTAFDKEVLEKLMEGG